KGNVFTGGVSTPGGTADDRNNVEQVHIAGPAIGQWTVRVSATAVNVQQQGYALVVAGDITPPGLGLSVVLNTTLPPAVQIGQALPLDVTVDPHADTLIPGSLQLFYRFDAGVFLTIPLTPGANPNTYTVTLPAPTSCSDHPQFYISAQSNESGVV